MQFLFFMKKLLSISIFFLFYTYKGFANPCLRTQSILNEGLNFDVHLRVTNILDIRDSEDIQFLINFSFASTLPCSQAGLLGSALQMNFQGQKFAGVVSPWSNKEGTGAAKFRINGNVLMVHADLQVHQIVLAKIFYKLGYEAFEPYASQNYVAPFVRSLQTTGALPFPSPLWSPILGAVIKDNKIYQLQIIHIED